MDVISNGSHLIDFCTANQSTGFYMNETLVLDALIQSYSGFHQFSSNEEE